MELAPGAIILMVGDYVKIGQVSQKYNVSSDTLRYYEKIGLIGPVRKNKSNVRNYDEEVLKQIEFVMCMRQANVSIEALIRYMKLYKKGDETLAERRKILQDELKNVNNQIKELKKAQSKLIYKIKLYDADLLEKSLGRES